MLLGDGSLLFLLILLLLLDFLFLKELFLAQEVLLGGLDLRQVFLLLVLVEHGPNVPIRLVDLLAALGARQHYFTARKDK